MVDESDEGRKTTVLSRIERLRELIEEDEPKEAIRNAYDEVRRELDALNKPGRGQGEESPVAAEAMARVFDDMPAPGPLFEIN